LSFALQDTKGDQAAGEVMPLSPLRARLRAVQAELILTDADHFFSLYTDVLHPTHLVSRQGQAIGRIVLGAVSDDQDAQFTCEPATLYPTGVAPIGAAWPLDRRFFLRRRTTYHP
jgi:hypothetical protein